MSERYYLTDAALDQLTTGGQSPTPLAGYGIEIDERGVTSIHCTGHGFITLLAGLAIAARYAPEEELRDVYRTILRTLTHE